MSSSVPPQSRRVASRRHIARLSGPTIVVQAAKQPLAMNEHARQLLAIAKENPWWTFTIEELSALTGYSRDVISAVKEHGARFPFGKSRPEWIIEWMAAHPRASLKNPLGQ